MAIRGFGKADRGVQVSRWDPLPQGSPVERSPDKRQGDGSIPSAATKFYCGIDWSWIQLGLISQRRQFESASRNHGGLVIAAAHLACNQEAGVQFSDPPPSFAWVAYVVMASV